MKSLSEVAAEALAGECESCAQIADEYAKRARASNPPAHQAATAAEHIARAIRQRKAPPASKKPD
jgi:hypothetical protein